MTDKRQTWFYILLIFFENILLIVCLVAGLIIFHRVMPSPKSDWERDVEKHGETIVDDYKARSPYVMFRPRGNIITELELGVFSKALVASAQDPRPSPGLRVWEQMPAKLRKQIVEIAEVSQMQPIARERYVETITYLNRLIWLPDFYKKEYFSGVTLPQNFHSLVQSESENLSCHDRALRNRLLLQAAFPDAIPEATIINSLGFFSPEIPREKMPNEFRLAMLGGSMVLCAHNHDEATPACLAQVLKNREPSLRDKTVTYINAGLPSGVSGQELAQLIWHVIPLNIDLLVVFDGFNDFFLPQNAYDRRPGYPFDYIVEEYRYYKFTKESHLVAALLSPFQELLKRVRPDWVVDDYYRELNIEVPSVEKVMPLILDNYFKNIQKMATIANAYHIKVAIFLQPFSTKHHDPARPEAKRFLKLYEEAAGRFQELSRGNNGMRVYQDLSYMREELAELFVDGVHYRQTPGNNIVT